MVAPINARTIETYRDLKTIISSTVVLRPPVCVVIEPRRELLLRIRAQYSIQAFLLTVGWSRR
jgi:hypothetical protein